MGPEQGDTPEKVDAQRGLQMDTMPGWVPPVAHGVVLVPPDSSGTADVRYPVVNVGSHGLPTLVMGAITGPRVLGRPDPRRRSPDQQPGEGGDG